MRVNAIDIVHHNPFLLTYTLPYVWCFAAAVLAVYLFCMIIVEMVNFVAYHVLYTTRIFLSYVTHEIAAVGHWAYVGIQHLYLFVRIFKE